MSKERMLRYVGGPRDGQLRPALLRSGRPVSVVGCADDAKDTGHYPGLYRRVGNELRWYSLPKAKRRKAR